MTRYNSEKRSPVDDLTRIQTIDRAPLALREDKTGQLHMLKGEMLVGREVECEIQLPFPQISRYHAKLYVSSNGVFVEDLKSSNGTYINGRKLRSRAQLSLGDQLAFDDITFRVTTARSTSTEDQTQIATSQNIPRDSVEAINAIAADKLKPAPSIPLENENNVLRSSPAPQQPPPQSQPQPTPQAEVKPENATPAGGNQSKEPKVHEIPDMEEFLRFAGSGLKPQEPPPAKKSSPFGLNKGQQPISEAPKGDIDPELEQAALAPLVEPGKPNSDPLEPMQATPPPSQLAQAQPLEQPQNQPPGPINSSETDDEETHYLSLNAMDRYVSTNQKYNPQDLILGSGPRLIAMTAPIRGKVFSLYAEDDVKCWSIGRDDSADICIRDTGVSREQAWITKLDAVYQLRINEDANDIFVNGQNAVELELTHGDRLQFGAMELLFRIDEPKKAPSENTETPQKKPSFFLKVLSFFK